MSYQALYRKWRPGEFEEVKGQDHIVTTLKNQIKADRIGHAYIFCGTRGTGKTTVAKIFAKAVNCLHPVDGNPCNECEMCKAINSQSSMNVIEIDAASNNGVDDIRQLREEVAYSPAEGKYKVYIIDEAHMITSAAFNALLKTLEEPPSYVIFIFATTDTHTMPVTILSRCQRYDFKRITIDTIAARLTELIERENLDVEEKAVRYIARAADGSLRDALSLLDQCTAFYLGERLTYDYVLEVLGAVDTSVFSRLLRAIDSCQFTDAVHLLEEVVIQGRELGQFVTDFIWYMRNLLLVQGTGNLEDILDMSSENLSVLKEEADMIDHDKIMRFIRVFSELSAQIRYSGQKRVLIEVALVKLCQPSMEGNAASLMRQVQLLTERVANLERQIAEGTFVRQEISDKVQQSSSQVQNVQDFSDQPIQKALPEDVKNVLGAWNSIISDAPGGMGVMLKNAEVAPGNDNQIRLGFYNLLHKGYFEKENNKADLEDIISRRIGKKIEVVLEMINNNTPGSSDFVIPDAINLSGVDFKFED